jgi:hypothetical protein
MRRNQPEKMRNDEEETLAMAAFQTSMDEEKNTKKRNVFRYWR